MRFVVTASTFLLVGLAAFILSWLWPLNVVFFRGEREEYQVAVSDGQLVISANRFSLQRKMAFPDWNAGSISLEPDAFATRLKTPLLTVSPAVAFGSQMTLLAAIWAWPVRRFARRRRRMRENRCLRCDYDLRGNQSGVCPECGTVLTSQLSS